MDRWALKLVCLLGLINNSVGLYCYECVSTHPSCGHNFNWILYWGIYCPEYDDRCVKLIERKGDEEIITRSCLSSLASFRRDIPADKYEGCRSAAKDVTLGNYVNHSIVEHDVHRTHYDNVTWCFCYFDDRCNSATRTSLTFSSALLLSISYLIR